MTIPTMPAETAVKVLSQFEAVGIRVWIDGGWAVDALLGHQSRRHGDLDIVLEVQSVQQTRCVLARLGYVDKVSPDTRPWNFVMADGVGHAIDFHVIDFDDEGNGMYGPSELGLSYPADSLTGDGSIGGYPVSCISPAWLVRFHTGYAIDEQDVHDVMALHERFGVPLPDEYQTFGRKAVDARDAHAGEKLVRLTSASLSAAAKDILQAAIYRPTSERIEMLLSSIYAESNSRLFGLMIGENIVAVLGIRLNSPSVAEILHIAVDEGHRGNGYGRQLLYLVAQEEELAGMFAETDCEAVRFYMRSGFSIESLGEKYPGVERFMCRWTKAWLSLNEFGIQQ